MCISIYRTLTTHEMRKSYEQSPSSTPTCGAAQSPQIHQLWNVEKEWTGYPTAMAASRGPRSREGLKQPRVVQDSDIVTTVIRKSIIRACIPALGGELPLSPGARMEHPTTALPSTSAKNAVETRI